MGFLTTRPIKRGSSLTQGTPHYELHDFSDQMSKFFENFFGSGLSETTMDVDWSPRVDIVEADAEWNIKAELPDINPEEIELSIDDNVLTIRGERKFNNEVSEDKYQRIERFYGTFERRFRLPASLDGDKISAAYKNGVLNVTIPKSEEVKPKKLEIKVSQ